MTTLYDVRMVWSAGFESSITVRASSPRHARERARELALSRTAVRPDRISVKKVRVFT